MLPAFTAACLLAFAPARLAPHAVPRTAAARSRPMVAPMDFVADLPFMEFALPQHPVADMALRQVVYTLRFIAGATGCEGALAGADLAADVRMFATASTVGTVRSARGLAAAVSGGTVLPGLQHASMLLHHPLMLFKWTAQHVAPGVAPGLAVSGRSVCAALWLAFIVAFALRNVQALRDGASGAERRTHQLTLSKLATDVPLATHFIMGAALLPLTVVGFLGSVSSILGIRAALTDPNKAPTPRLAMPLPRWSMRNVAVAAPACAGNSGLGGPRPALVSCVAAAAPTCGTQQRRRKIGGGPLSSSCEW